MPEDESATKGITMAILWRWPDDTTDVTAPSVPENAPKKTNVVHTAIAMRAIVFVLFQLTRNCRWSNSADRLDAFRCIGSFFRLSDVT